MSKVLVVATSRKTRGGITAVVKAHESGLQWKKYHCKWIETHIDNSKILSVLYCVRAFFLYLFNLPVAKIVHIHLSEPMSLLRKTLFFFPAKLFGKHIIIHLHSYSPDTSINGKFHWLYKIVFSKADLLLVLSPYWKRAVEYSFGKQINVEILYNPCPLKYDGYTVLEKRKQILFAGTITERKGYQDLIKAFAIISNQFSDWKLVIAGNGDLVNAKQLAKDLGIERSILFPGWVRGCEKDALFKQSMIFCLPSYNEGFPMAVLDAWSYELPVITTPVGGIADIAKDGENLLIFKSGDVDTLAYKLRLLMSNDSLRSKIAASSKYFAENVFNVERVNEQLSGIYEKYF